MSKLIELFKSNQKSILVILFFAILSAAYFSPALNGYTLKQSDISSWKAAAKELSDFRETHNEVIYFV